MSKKNTLENASFRFLIFQDKTKFVGICRETGYVEEGETANEVSERLSNGTIVIVEAIKKDITLLPSINQRPPLKYRFLFFWIPFWYSLKNLISLMPREIELINRTLSELNNTRACEI